MPLKHWLRLTAISLCLTLTSGCSNTAEVEVKGDKTIGRELQELDEAYQKGTINRQEYEKIRQRIIEGD